MKVKAIKSNKKINLDEYVNVKTGEQLLSKFNGSTIFISDKTEVVSVSSDNYVVFDTKVMIHLIDYFNRSELGSIYLLSSDLKTELNLIYNHNVPHTNESLMKKLNITSSSTFNLLMKKLMKHGVIHQLKGKVLNQSRMIYMMNPFLARKRKTIHKDVVEIFNEFQKIIK